MAHRWATRAVLSAGAMVLLTLVACEQGADGVGSFFVQNYCDLECPYGFRTDAVGTPFCACAEQECIDRPPTRSYRPGPVEPEPYTECYEVCDCNFLGICDCYDECYDGEYYDDEYYDDCEWAESEEEYEECIGNANAPAPPAMDNCQPDWISDGDCDTGNNTDDCDYDGGDCCAETCSDTDAYMCGGSGFNCIDPGVTGGEDSVPPEDIDYNDGQCVEFASECDIPEGYIPCPGCSFQGRNLQPGDIAEISGARWLCQENGQVTMLPPLTEPEPSPEPEPGFCTHEGQTVSPGSFVNPTNTCEVCVCNDNGSVDCDPASCFVCDEDEGGYPPGTAFDVYGIACVCDISGTGVCGVDCLYDGTHLPNGETIATDECGTCTCSTGRVSCDGCTEPEPEPSVEPEGEPEGEPDGPTCAAPVFCDEPAPACAADEIPSVVAGCYGPCVYWSDCVEVDFGCNPPPGEFCDANLPACDFATETVTYRGDCYGPCVPEAYCAGE